MSFARELDELRDRHEILDFPAIAHTGFHPDLIRPKIGKKLVRGPLGSNHSALVLFAYLEGLDEAETEKLFCEDVFARLGYFEACSESDRHFVSQLQRFGLFDHEEVERLRAGGCFMHNTIHPKLSVIGLLARAILRKCGVVPRVRFPENLMADDFANNVVWPVYPPLAQRMGNNAAEYVFQFKPTADGTFGLPDFIAASFRAYRETEVDASAHPRLTSDDFLRLSALLKTGGMRASPVSSNPYRGMPDASFWRRAVATPPSDEIDPVVSAPFKIDAETRIGTAGSCFAQHIARRLAASGHAYLQTETGGHLNPAERKRRNYGVYSARYGNIYTVRQLCQLFERASGTFAPQDSAWRREDGRYVDPFRPEIEPDGFASVAALEADREAHLRATMELFASVDVLVFTLGLTEAWRSRADGSVFPLCPMVVSAEVSPADYEPVNFGHDEVVADLGRFIALLRSVNAAARLLLTVSPVPLIATFENRHVLVSTAASKAVLRSAADVVSRTYERVAYFPSFEIVANPYVALRYFDPVDCRSVLPEGVDHVMRVFMEHYSTLAPKRKGSIHAAEIEEAQQVVCEEERMDL